MQHAQQERDRLAIALQESQNKDLVRDQRVAELERTFSSLMNEYERFVADHKSAIDSSRSGGGNSDAQHEASVTSTSSRESGEVQELHNSTDSRGQANQHNERGQQIGGEHTPRDSQTPDSEVPP